MSSEFGGDATGYYPFQIAGELYVGTRNGSDPRIHRWNAEAARWSVVDNVPNASERIAGKLFHVDRGNSDKATESRSQVMISVESLRRLSAGRVIVGRGVYGPSTMKIESVQVQQSPESK